MRKIILKTVLLLLVSTVIFLNACTTSPVPIAEDKKEAQPSVSPDKETSESGESIVQTEVPFEIEEIPFTTLGFAQDLYDILQTGSIDEALLLFETVPEEFEEDFSVNYLHASLLFSAGNYEEAKLLTKKLEIQQPNNVDVIMLNTMIAKAQGDTAKKKELLEKVIEKDPANSDANVEMAHDQMLRSNFGLAKKYYLKGLESDPLNPDALLGLGQTSYYIGELSQAEQVFTKITENYPENSLAWAYRGKVAAEDENYKKATDYIEKALALEDDYYDFWVDYGNYLRYQGKYEQAEQAWTRAIDIDDSIFLAYIYRAALYDEENEYDKALADYQKIIQIKPEYPYSYESLGMIYWYKGDWTNSRIAFTKAYTLNSANISYPLMISASYIQEGKKTENREFLSMIMKNRDRDSIEYAILRLYYDGINPSSVERKILSVENATLKGKLFFYMGLFYDLYGDDLSAKKQYIIVKDLQSPMFFEYKMNQWALEKEE